MFPKHLQYNSINIGHLMFITCMNSPRNRESIHERLKLQSAYFKYIIFLVVEMLYTDSCFSIQLDFACMFLSHICIALPGMQGGGLGALP